MTDRAPRKRSLRNELVIQLTLLVAGGLVLPSLLVMRPATLPALDRPLSLGLAIAADVLVFATAAWLLLRRALLRPLRDLAGATDRASTARRLAIDAAPVQELQEVSAAIERLAARVIDDQTDRLRVEKVASNSRLSATVARTLDDSLGAMLSIIHVLRRQLLRRAAPSQDLELLAKLEQESTRLEHLVRGLRDYARGRPVTMIPVDIEEIIKAVVADLRAQGALENVEVILELTGAPVSVLATRADLEQLFSALVVNATDAMNGHGRIVVRLERAARFTVREPAARRGEVNGEAIEHPPSSRARPWLATNDAAEIAKIVVADSGPGVPAALAERIFDPFFTTKPPGKGAGLGLSIAARTVENFRGAIWVTSSREGGAAFHLLFPMAHAAKAARLPKPRPTPAAARRRITR